MNNIKNIDSWGLEINEREALQTQGGIWFLWAGAIVAILGIISAWNDIVKPNGDD